MLYPELCYNKSCYKEVNMYFYFLKILKRSNSPDAYTFVHRLFDVCLFSDLHSIALSVCCLLNRETKKEPSSIAFPTGFRKKMRIAHQVIQLCTTATPKEVKSNCNYNSAAGRWREHVNISSLPALSFTFFLLYFSLSSPISSVPSLLFSGR